MNEFGSLAVSRIPLRLIELLLNTPPQGQCLTGVLHRFSHQVRGASETLA